MGWLFVLVTPLSILPGIPFGSENPPGWWHSVSQTYYANSSIMMIGVFMMLGVISFSYRARNIIEKIGMVFLGASCLGVVVFPHAHDAVENTGFFHISGECSVSIHYIFAAICFVCISFLPLLFAFMPEQTEKKHQRNVVYLSSWALIGLSSILVVLAKKGMAPEWTTLFLEFIMFTLFGADLLCCAGKIPFLR